MKKLPLVLALSTVSFLLTVRSPAQDAGNGSKAGSKPAENSDGGLKPADRAWLDLKAAAFTSSVRAGSKDAEARKAALAEQARGFVRTAERARKFYEENPRHEKSHEAKLIEVRALVSASQAGDATVDGQLTTAVQSFRSDPSIPANLRVQIVAAYAFPKAMRAAKNREERLAEAVAVARSLAMEFPEQPQGTESLVNLAEAFGSVEARKLANEVLGMAGPASAKESARRLLARLDLIGKPLAAEFDGADLSSAKTALSEGRPTVIYTWATWSPGSFQLAADLRKLNPAANIVGLNLDKDTATAEAIAGREGFVGRQLYDRRGRDGSLAQRLMVRGAGQVILTDARGVIVELKGEADLKGKLQSAGL